MRDTVRVLKQRRDMNFNAIIELLFKQSLFSSIILFSTKKKEERLVNHLPTDCKADQVNRNDRHLLMVINVEVRIVRYHLHRACHLHR